MNDVQWGEKYNRHSTPLKQVKQIVEIYWGDVLTKVIVIFVLGGMCNLTMTVKGRREEMKYVRSQQKLDVMKRVVDDVCQNCLQNDRRIFVNTLMPVDFKANNYFKKKTGKLLAPTSTDDYCTAAT